MREKTQPLRGDLPLLKIFRAGSGESGHDKYISKFMMAGLHYWIQASSSRESSYGTVPIHLYPEEDEVTASARFNDELSIFAGTHPFTSSAYPACSYWKH